MAAMGTIAAISIGTAVAGGISAGAGSALASGVNASAGASASEDVFSHQLEATTKILKGSGIDPAAMFLSRSPAFTHVTGDNYVMERVPSNIPFSTNPYMNYMGIGSVSDPRSRALTGQARVNQSTPGQARFTPRPQPVEDSEEFPSWFSI